MWVSCIGMECRSVFGLFLGILNPSFVVTTIQLIADAEDGDGMSHPSMSAGGLSIMSAKVLIGFTQFFPFQKDLGQGQ